MWFWVIIAIIPILLYVKRKDLEVAIMAAKGFINHIFFRQNTLTIDDDLQSILYHKTVLITGANRGLGKGIATQAIAYGLKTVVACRSGLEDVKQNIIKAAQQENIRFKRDVKVNDSRADVVSLDLSDIDSINKCIDVFKQKKFIFDYVICNAAVVPSSSSQNKYGIETAVMTNYIGHLYLMTRLQEEQLIASADNYESKIPLQYRIPRFVIITSEVHRVAKLLSQQPFDQFQTFDWRQAVSMYAHTKLLVATYAFELSRQVNKTAPKNCDVYAICPGPVASDIDRAAPNWLKKLFAPFKAMFFRDPLHAALPVLRLLFMPTDIQKLEARYFHMWDEKPARQQAIDPEIGHKLWQDSQNFLVKIGAIAAQN